MKPTTPISAPLRLAEGPLLWTGHARAHVDAVISARASRRLLLTGPSGSGKSGVLRHLRGELAAAGSTISTTRSRTEIAAVPAGHVLVIDDAHLLDVGQLSALMERSADPDAALVLAARPWPQSDGFRALAERLERSQPAVVLGSIGRADVHAYLEQTGDIMSDACLDAVLEATGGTAWLVSESLAVHDTTDCAGDADHDALHDVLRDVIAHRLRTVAPPVRHLVEHLCLGGDDGMRADRDDLILSAYAEGLLLPGGRPAPVVRSAVRATSSIERVIRLYEDTVGAGRGPDAAGTGLDSLVDGVHDAHLAELLLQHGDAVGATDPRRARELYRRAREAGADPATAAIREARAEWQLGGVEAASRLLDGARIPAEHPDHDAAADTAAAVWAARGLTTMSDAVYRAFAPSTPTSRARATVAAFAVADAGLLDTTSAHARGPTMPSTLAVAMDLLESGLRATLTTSADASLGELIRAAEMYSAARTSAPIPELPAVVAALAALHVGEPDVALAVLDRALDDRHGGAWAQDRLVLWRAWVALQLERAHEVEEALEAIAPTAHALSPRERLLFDALSVSIARRYHDAVALTVAWRAARESLMRASFDLFSILPLGEFVVTAARVGEPERVEAHFAQALARLEQLGSPPLWAAHAHWAGIQQAILRGRPQDMTSHAHALIDAAPHSRLASIMAQAGRVWTNVLSGTVDVEAVEAAATALGTVGLAWDGARLAGHGAGHTDDRRLTARLLAAARRLHPHEDLRPPAVESDAVSAQRPRTPSDLSPRELEVAALVVQGKTYAEIGATIFISPRTAEHHIARIRRRLGATNRSDLIAKLRVALDDADGDDAGHGGARASA
ncbi:LuxR C-terminal-related transcriptional regulator [Microbacterium terricola]|uniref:LuxR family transcriptional regulator n=1 Tax=Microbacterium terricola TaxID=344163 RepID=A0ABM8E2C1_9MICO|nr:LuxR C-terminal-related transcriptional regulator [Microbacterium terricola]UYK40351.1 LuxR C-terminal-related transcriptional regulator [Microbacterium terricola]BDV31935.1 LuxR family transcriptional regulator [Microbacterium terricola]